MTDPSNVHHVEIIEDGRTVAAAAVTTSTGPDPTADVDFHAESGHLPAGTRSKLVDAVMDDRGVQDSAHLLATLPAGDAESMTRLRERTTDMTTHAAGSTTLVEATLPSGDVREP